MTPGPDSYLMDNGPLVPDVWAGLLDINEWQKPRGLRKADFYVVEVRDHLIFYKFYSPTRKRILVIKPKEDSTFSAFLR